MASLVQLLVAISCALIVAAESAESGSETTQATLDAPFCETAAGSDDYTDPQILRLCILGLVDEVKRGFHEGEANAVALKNCESKVALLATKGEPLKRKMSAFAKKEQPEKKQMAAFAKRKSTLMRLG